jgi:hypothetical protein
MKTLLNSKEDFDNWVNNNDNYNLIDYEETKPKNYPCIVVYRFEDNYYSNTNWCYYEFVYLTDFENL